MKRSVPYIVATSLALTSSILYSADHAQARKLADYAVEHGKHTVYSASGHDVDEFYIPFTIREETKDELSKLDIQLSRLLVDGREVLSMTGTVFNPANGNYMRLQLDDGGLVENLPLDGKLDTFEMSVSDDGGKTFRQTQVPEDINKNGQNIFDIYVGKLLRKIGFY